MQLHFLSLAVLAFLIQEPTPTIQGVVVNATNGDPLPRAVVELCPANESSCNTTMTSAQGSFVFRNVVPGQYKLTVTRAGFVPMEYKSRITVAQGVQNPDFRFTLTPTGTIYGRIADRSGQPLANVTVRALRTSSSDGQFALTTEQTAITNDLGEYRLFWLRPGSYFVSALPFSSGQFFGEMLTSGVDPKNDMRTGFGSRAVPGIESVSVGTLIRPILNKSVGALAPNEAYVSTYFPGTADQDRATAVDVRSGASVGSIDISVAPVETHHIRGVIMNGVTRQPAPRAQLRRARASALTTCASAGMNPDCSYAAVDYDKATFDIEQVTPGSYVLFAMESDLVAQTVIDVQDSDVDNLVLTLRPSITVTGKVLPARAGVEIRLSPGPPIPGRAPLAGSSSPDGAFQIRGLTPGDYTVTVSSLKGNYVKSIAAGATDVMNRGLHVTGQSDPSLEIVFGTNPGRIEGRVLNAQGEPAVDVKVMLIREATGDQSTQTDPEGRYQFDNLAPGNYRLLALEERESVAWKVADYMRFYKEQGKPIQVIEGSTLPIDINF